MKYLPYNQYKIKKPCNNYSKQPDEFYGRKVTAVELEALIDSIQVREMPPGLRGYCFLGIRKVFVREGDQDPGSVNYHENKHLQVGRQDPYHSEAEIRRLEYWRCGDEDCN